MPLAFKFLGWKLDSRPKLKSYFITPMKRILFLILLINIFTIISAQEDSVIVSIHYMSTIKKYVEKKAYEEEMVLDVAQDKSAFYDRWYHMRREIRDSVKKAGGKFAEMMKATSHIPSPLYQIYYFTNYPQKGERMKTDFLGKTFYFTEKIEPVKWELIGKDSIIAEYKCQSAVGTYRGHKWHVYYTTEIPFSVGPWKLHGLPGAILYAKEDLGNATFEAIEVRTQKKKLPVPNLERAIKCTREDYRQMRIEYAHNPREFYKKRLGHDLKGWNADGTPIIYKPKTAIFLED